MDLDEKVHFYRLLDATYGALESSERIREELIRARQRSSVNRLLVLLLTITAAVPALYSVLPDTIGGIRWVYIGFFCTVAVAFAVAFALQWWEGKQDAKEADSSFGKLSEPFLLLRTSTYFTRWIMASGIATTAPPGRIKSNFAVIQRNWEERLRDVRLSIDELLQKGAISAETHGQLISWFALFDSPEDPTAGGSRDE